MINDPNTPRFNIGQRITTPFVELEVYDSIFENGEWIYTVLDDENDEYTYTEKELFQTINEHNRAARDIEDNHE